MADDFPFRSADMPDSRASNGGQQSVKEIPYSPPQGPAGQMRQGPGLGGTNHGVCGTQGRH